MPFRIQVTLVKTDGEWLVDDFTPGHGSRADERRRTGTTSSTSTRTATTDEIRAAWRDAIADLTPADRRFRLYNQAAEVLLDPEQRAAYDAELRRARPGRAGAGRSARAGPIRRRSRCPTSRHRRSCTEARPERRAGRRPGCSPSWRVLAALSVGLAAYLFSQPSEAAVEEATGIGAGRGRAGGRAGAVLRLPHARRGPGRGPRPAHLRLPPRLRRPVRGHPRQRASRPRPWSRSRSSPRPSSGPGTTGSRSCCSSNRPTTNAQTEEPVVYKDQVTVTMERVDDEWLVDDLKTSPVAQ